MIELDKESEREKERRCKTMIVRDRERKERIQLSASRETGVAAGAVKKEERIYSSSEVH